MNYKTQISSAELNISDGILAKTDFAVSLGYIYGEQADFLRVRSWIEMKSCPFFISAL